MSLILQLISLAAVDTISWTACQATKSGWRRRTSESSRKTQSSPISNIVLTMKKIDWTDQDTTSNAPRIEYESKYQAHI